MAIGWRGTGALAFLLVALSGGVAASAQRVLLANPTTGTVSIVDPEGTALGMVMGLGAIAYVGTDGAERAWVSSIAQSQLYRIDFAGPTVTSFEQGKAVYGVSGTADGGAAFTTFDSGQGVSQLERVDSEGVMVWAVNTLVGARLVCVDRVGQIWVTHQTGASPASLGRYSAQGQLLSLHPLGIAPSAIMPDRFGSIWVVCGLSGQLFRYRDSGDHVETISLPGLTALDIAQDAQGNIFLSFGIGGIFQVRDADGGSVINLPLNGILSGVACDGGDGVWIHDVISGVVTRHGGLFSQSSTFPLGPGASLIGDFTGLSFAGAAGYQLDPDGDGVPSGIELEAGANPFDFDSSPMGITPLIPLEPGIMTQLEIRSAGTPHALYWLGASIAPLPLGSGAQGFSLFPGESFDFFQSTGTEIVSGLFGLLDAYGVATTGISIPPGQGLIGYPFYMAFRVFPGFPNLEVSMPSPAYRLDIQ